MSIYCVGNDTTDKENENQASRSQIKRKKKGKIYISLKKII